MKTNAALFPNIWEQGRLVLYVGRNGPITRRGYFAEANEPPIAVTTRKLTEPPTLP